MAPTSISEAVMALPIPRFAPVTIATLPLTSNVLMSLPSFRDAGVRSGQG